MKPGYKQTELGIIPENWRIFEFADVSFMKGRIGWQGLKQAEFTDNADEPYLITGMNFKDGAIRWEEVYHVSEERYEVAKEIQLKESDVLMTKDGTIGKLLFVESIPYPYRATLNSHLLLFRPLNKAYDPKYLYYHLSSPNFRRHIELTKSGTTFFGISQTSVGEYQIILPPISEQTAIATALSDADAIIQKLEQLLTKKRNIKTGAVQELLRPKEGWVVKKLGEVVNKFMNGGTPSTTISKYWEGHIPWISGADILNQKIVQIRRYITGEAVRNSSTNVVEKGNLLFVSRTGVGKLAIAPFDIAISQDFTGIYLNSTLLISEFLYRFLDSISEKLQNQNQGTSIQGITRESLSSLMIPVPPIETQTRIAKILSDMDNEIEELEKQVGKYKMLKQGMMQNLLTGKIRLV